MNTIRDRATDKFPMVLLTLLSIVQALALEFLWDHARQREDLFEWTLAVLPGWLQIAATLNIIILIWLMYAGMLMRFRWTPTLSDSILPFFVGLIQFFMIDIMGSENFATWVIATALSLGALNTINHRAMKRARRDPANSEFFEQFLPATLRDFLPDITQVVLLLAAGIWIAMYDTGDWFSVVVLVGVFIGLAYETFSASMFWKVSMGEKRLR